MARKVIAHSKGCEDGNCPTIWQDTETGDVVVRGYTSQDGSTEADVRIPAGDWAFIVSQLPR